MPSAAAAASAEDEPAVVAAFVANVEDDADVANALVWFVLEVVSLVALVDVESVCRLLLFE